LQQSTRRAKRPNTEKWRWHADLRTPCAMRVSDSGHSAAESISVLRRFVNANQIEYLVPALCRVLDVSQVGLWMARSSAERTGPLPRRGERAHRTKTEARTALFTTA